MNDGAGRCNPDVTNAKQRNYLLTDTDTSFIELNLMSATFFAVERQKQSKRPELTRCRWE
jgi:hypothetical protein